MVKKFMIPGLAALAAAVVVLLLVEMGDNSDNDKPSTKSAETSDLTKTARIGPRTKTKTTLPKNIVSENSATQEETKKFEKRIANEVPQEVYQAAASCYAGELGKHESMTVHYQLTYKNGLGRLSNVRKGDSNLGNPDLEDCIVEKLSGHTWTDPNSPQYDTEFSTELSLLGLRKRNTPFGANPNELIQTEPPEDELED